MTVPETLRKAAVLIEERGHCKQRFTGLDGGLCMYQSVVCAAGSKKEENDAIKALSSHLPPRRTVYAGELMFNPYNICDFNNAHTKEEVVSKLREVADVEELERIPTAPKHERVMV